MALTSEFCVARHEGLLCNRSKGHAGPHKGYLLRTPEIGPGQGAVVGRIWRDPDPDPRGLVTLHDVVLGAAPSGGLVVRESEADDLAVSVNALVAAKTVTSPSAERTQRLNSLQRDLDRIMADPEADDTLTIARLGSLLASLIEEMKRG